MKNVKKVIGVCAAVVMLFLLAACGGNATGETQDTTNGGTDAGSDVTISFWMQRYGADPSVQENLMNNLVSQFYSETGINVEVVYVDWGQALTRYTLASTGGEAPDVGDVFFLQSLVQMGNNEFGPMEINDLAAEIGMDQFYESILHEAMVGDDFYGIPWRADTRVLALNMEILSEAGFDSAPTTWDELITMAQATATHNSDGSVARSGLLWNTTQARFDQTWYAVLAQAGGQVLSDDFSSAVFDSPEGMESLQFMQNMITEYNVMPSTVIDPSFEPETEFLAGNAAMLFGVTPSFRVNVEANAPQMLEQVQLAVLPTRDGTGPSSIAFAAPVAIFRTTEHPEEAKEWVRFFTSVESQIQVSDALNQLNSNRFVMEADHIANDVFLTVFSDQFERAVMGDPPIPAWSQISAWPDGPISQMTTNIMAGRDVNEFVTNAIREVNELIDSID